jgi:glucosylceramidase
MALPLLAADTQYNISNDIKGASYQWYGKFAIDQMAKSFPGIPLIQSENECGYGDNSWEFMKYVFGLVHHYMEAGVRAYCYWNMVLPAKNGISTWGMEQNSLVSIVNEPTFNNEYFLFKHLSKFVGAGSVYLDASGAFAAMSVCFKNADGQTVITVKNPLETDKELVIDCGGKQYKITLTADSVTTAVVG